jgi:hypothetical protein
MMAVIGEPERPRRLAKNSAAALFECLLEAVELIPVVCAALVGFAALCVVGDMLNHWMFDPNAVDVATRLDMLSIDPNKWFPRS